MANIAKNRNTFSLSDVQDEIFNRLFDLSWPLRNRGDLSELQVGDWAPRIDIQEEKDHYLIKADVPGVEPKNIEVTLENGILTIKGKKEEDVEEKKDNFIRIERSRGSFTRQFTLPDTVDSEEVSAKSKHGVLEIIIPKSKKSSSRKIKVEE